MCIPSATHLLFPPGAETTFPPPCTICWLSLQHGKSQWSSWLATWFTYFSLDNESSYREHPITPAFESPAGIMLSHISMVIYFASFESRSCLRQTWLSCLLGVWEVCGWKTAVNCIDKKPRATIWASGVQYEGWLIDWHPGVMQAEGHKHTNTLWYLCYTNRRGGWMRSQEIGAE